MITGTEVGACFSEVAPAVIIGIAITIVQVHRETLAAVGSFPVVFHEVIIGVEQRERGRTTTEPDRNLGIRHTIADRRELQRVGTGQIFSVVGEHIAILIAVRPIDAQTVLRIETIVVLPPVRHPVFIGILGLAVGNVLVEPVAALRELLIVQLVTGIGIGRILMAEPIRTF